MLRTNSFFPIFFIIALIGSTSVPAAPPAEELRDTLRPLTAEIQERHHVAGMAVAVFDAQRILYAEGFGFADVEKQQPVDPNTTLFRAGSISKLFTWTAVMQLAEQGRLELARNVQDYLDFPPGAEPTGSVIRMLDLMGHTPGYEDRVMGLFYKDPARLQTLRDALVVRPPARVLPAGKEIRYSNYGVMLAGYIVERLSDLSFEEYIEAQVFRPLGINHATFRQPLPASFQNREARGYVWDGEKYIPQQFELVNGTPAGGVSISAVDLARFFQAHMRDGAGLLRPETARKMQRRHAGLDPAGNGVAHGFLELTVNGRRGLGHAGSTMYAHSWSGFYPEENIGFVVLTNTNTGNQAALEWYESFIERFLPGPTGDELAERFTKQSDPGIFSGRYHMARRPESSMMKMLSLFMQANVRPDGAGGLEIATILDQEPRTYVEVAPRVFQQRDGGRRIVFRTDDEGRIESLFLDTLPITLFQRAPWYENFELNLGLIGIGLLCLIVGLFARPTGLFAWLSRAYRDSLSADERGAAVFGAGALLAYLIFFLTATLITGDDPVFTGHPPRWPFVIPLFGFGLTLVATVFALRSWSTGYWSKIVRVHYSILCVGLLGLFAFLFQWNLTVL